MDSACRHSLKSLEYIPKKIGIWLRLENYFLYLCNMQLMRYNVAVKRNNLRLKVDSLINAEHVYIWQAVHRYLPNLEDKDMETMTLGIHANALKKTEEMRRGKYNTRFHARHQLEIERYIDIFISRHVEYRRTSNPLPISAENRPYCNAYFHLTICQNETERVLTDLDLFLSSQHLNIYERDLWKLMIELEDNYEYKDRRYIDKYQYGPVARSIIRLADTEVFNEDERRRWEGLITGLDHMNIYFDVLTLVDMIEDVFKGGQTNEPKVRCKKIARPIACYENTLPEDPYPAIWELINDLGSNH